jgi:hypothetical protein
MKTNKSMLCVFGFMLLFTAVAATAADAPKRTFKFKPVEIPGAPDTVVNGVNNERWLGNTRIRAGACTGTFSTARS